MVDERHVAIVPTLLGRGERIFPADGPGFDGYECVEFAPSSAVAHVRSPRV